MSGKYFDGERWLEIEDGMVLTNHYGQSEFFHPIHQCTDKCSVDYFEDCED